jgi:hypothetical protein
MLTNLKKHSTMVSKRIYYLSGWTESERNVEDVIIIRAFQKNSAARFPYNCTYQEGITKMP